MATIAIVLINKPRKDGRWPIKIRIFHRRKLSYQTLCYINPANWNISGQVNLYEPGYLTLNEKIRERRCQIEEILEAFEAEGKGFSGPEILQINYSSWKASRQPVLPKADPASTSFLKHAEFLIHLKNRNQNLASAKRYTSYLHTLRQYLHTLQQTDLELMEVTDEFLIDFFRWCRTKTDQPNNENTLHRRFGWMAWVVRDALADGLISKLPFRRFKTKPIKVPKVKLRQDQIQQLEQLAMSTHKRPLARSLKTYLLQFHLYGSRISDVLTLRNHNVTEEGSRVEFVQRKTKKLMSIRLNEKARALISEFHCPERPDAFLIPWLKWEHDPSETVEENEYRLLIEIENKTTMANKYLKDASQLLDFEKPISTHSARHSFAQMAKRKKVDIYALKQALGHSSIKQTETYLNDLDTDEVDQAMNGVYD
ncbi:tyrosine-type recombinase/integrase [Larkinella bovis]|uniref:Tyrosine-type recombinase/integrase n=1 Tax=Larkinella bovis TaxID=683041 RepID=A0ABW0IBM2_9BACT